MNDESESGLLAHQCAGQPRSNSADHHFHCARHLVSLGSRHVPTKGGREQTKKEFPLPRFALKTSQEKVFLSFVVRSYR